jgi:Zn-dependent M28 family amino/carboxypeptidase
MDNASGVASLIEFARYAKSMRSPFRRSVVLLAVTGEEEQLFGSMWYAARPTVPARAIVADINLDMFLPILPLRTITVYGRAESDLGARFTAVAARAGIGVEDDPEPNRNYFIRSDQYSFIRHGVPSLFFEIGAGADTSAKSKLAAWNRDHYHDVSDDLSQPVDLEVAAAFTHLLFDFTRDVANAKDAPKWAPESYFRHFATAQAHAGMAAARHGVAKGR